MSYRHVSTQESLAYPMTFPPPLFFLSPSSSLQTLTNLVDHVLGTSGPKMVHHAVRLAGRHGVVQDDRAEGK